jgi:hypothetical protein
MLGDSVIETAYIARYIKLAREFEYDPISYDLKRTRAHDIICQRFELEKDETKEITANLDRYDYDPLQVYKALLKIMCEKQARKPEAGNEKRGA